MHFSIRTARVYAELVLSSTTNWISKVLRPTAGWTASLRSADALCLCDFNVNLRHDEILPLRATNLHSFFELISLMRVSGKPKMCHRTDPSGCIQGMRVTSSLLLQPHLRPIWRKPGCGDGHVSTSTSF